MLQSPPWAPVGLSCAEIRHLVWQLVLAVERTAKAVLKWSAWRRWHQAWARYHHYRRRTMRDTPPPAQPTPGLEPGPAESPGELDDVCWALLDRIIPHPKPGGRLRGYTRRQFAEAYAYLLRHGCRWRELPTSFPPWHTVYERVRTWRRAGVLEQIWAILCARQPPQNVREAASPM